MYALSFCSHLIASLIVHCVNSFNKCESLNQIAPKSPFTMLCRTCTAEPMRSLAEGEGGGVFSVRHIKRCYCYLQFDWRILLNSLPSFIWCCYFGFFCDILSPNVKMYLWLKLYTVPFFVSGQTYKISKGSNKYRSHCIWSVAARSIFQWKHQNIYKWVEQLRYIYEHSKYTSQSLLI